MGPIGFSAVRLRTCRRASRPTFHQGLGCDGGGLGKEKKTKSAQRTLTVKHFGGAQQSLRGFVEQQAIHKKQFDTVQESQESCLPSLQ